MDFEIEVNQFYKVTSVATLRIHLHLGTVQ